MYSIVCNRACRRITSSSKDRFTPSSWVFSFVRRAKVSSNRIYAALPNVARSRPLAWRMILRISSCVICLDETSWRNMDECHMFQQSGKLPEGKQYLTQLALRSIADVGCCQQGKSNWGVAKSG